MLLQSTLKCEYALAFLVALNDYAVFKAKQHSVLLIRLRTLILSLFGMYSFNLANLAELSKLRTSFLANQI